MPLNLNAVHKIHFSSKAVILLIDIFFSLFGSDVFSYIAVLIVGLSKKSKSYLLNLFKLFVFMRSKGCI